MMDGQGAQKVGEMLSDFERDPPPRPAHTGLAHATTGAAPTELEVYARSIASLARLPARAVREALSMLRPALLAPRGSHVGRGSKSAVVTPKLACNGAIGAQRGLACVSLPLADVLRVKKRFEVSVNDVLLALTASAMRSYLSRTDSLPLEPLRANIAVSLRKEGDQAVSNAVTSVNVCLHTDVADPAARLAAIHAGADVAKRHARREQSSMYELVNAMPPFAASLLTRAMTPDMVLAAMKCNLIVSNVRGSARPMYMAGARVSAIYPMSLLVTGIGLNLTCISYADSIDCGITYEPDLAPHASRIAEGLREALREYLVLSRKPVKAERSPVGRTNVRATMAKVRPTRTVGRVARKAASRSPRP